MILVALLAPGAAARLHDSTGMPPVAPKRGELSYASRRPAADGSTQILGYTQLERWTYARRPATVLTFDLATLKKVQIRRRR